MSTIQLSPYQRLVRASAIYDLVTAAAFAVPILAAPKVEPATVDSPVLRAVRNLPGL